MTWQRNSWVSISFFTSIFKSVKIPSKPNCVSLRPEIKEGLIYYLIAKYMVTSRCKEQPTHQLQKANSTFLVVRLGIKIFVIRSVPLYEWFGDAIENVIFLNCQIGRNEIFFFLFILLKHSWFTKVKLLEISSVFFNLYKCQSTDISENRTINQLDPRNTNKIKFS